MSAYRPYGSGSPALDRLLQNPSEFGYSRMEGYPYRPEERGDSDDARLGGHLPLGVPPVGGAPTAKRGSKACVACGSAAKPTCNRVVLMPQAGKGRTGARAIQQGRARHAGGVRPTGCNASLKSRQSAARVELDTTV